MIKNMELTIIIFLSILAVQVSANSVTSNNYFFSSMDDYLVSAEVMPEPVGGITAIYKNISYPSAAKAAHTQGKVFLMVMVNENGSVDEVKVIKGIGNGCDEAAMDGVKKAKFTPGKSKGATVKVKLALAIEFKL
ncbi:MAG: hypothetical protein A2X61_04865 [Ignavibacteria bacterium GWB2_35_12]|nr:MAG: hypothetical protein A2X61_04865 [Ignavibacteria bacterium GWB2_35_12]